MQLQKHLRLIARWVFIAAAVYVGYWLLIPGRPSDGMFPLRGLVTSTRAASDRDLVRHETIGATEYWLFRTPRRMESIHEAFAYLVDKLDRASNECALRSVAVATGWPETKLAVESVVFSFYPCGSSMYYMATVTNDDRNLYVVATPPPKAIQWGGAPLRMDELSVDVSDALSIAGKRAGNDMLSKFPRETQVSLFLSRRAEGATWEVRYDAWRDGRPLRFLAVTIDARTSRVLGTSD